MPELQKQYAGVHSDWNGRAVQVSLQYKKRRYAGFCTGRLLEYVHSYGASLVEIFGFAYVRLAYYCIVIVYRGLAMTAAAVLLCQHARIDCAVLLVILGYHKDPRQGFRLS